MFSEVLGHQDNEDGPQAVDGTIGANEEAPVDKAAKVYEF